jgi:hypothetical protein
VGLPIATENKGQESPQLRAIPIRRFLKLATGAARGTLVSKASAKSLPVRALATLCGVGLRHFRGGIALRGCLKGAQHDAEV